MVIVVGVLVVVSVVLGGVALMLVVGFYVIPSEGMAPTLNGCKGCAGDHILVERLTYRFGSPQPGDVVVFKAPPAWNSGDTDLVKRVIAVGGQTIECRSATGLVVDGRPLTEPYLDPVTMMADPHVYPCLGNEFGPVTVPEGRLWLMGDNRTHSADSRAHCASVPFDVQRGLLCTGDPTAATVSVSNVVGKVRLITSPASRRGAVDSVNPQTV